MPFGRYAVLQLALARQFSWRRTVVQTSALITGGECGFSLAVGPAQKKAALFLRSKT
jgi:hypothetical protein